LKPVLLITGGGRGIGAATALLAARQGHAVAINYATNSLAADEVARQIRSEGGSAMTVQADVADESQVLAMFERVQAKLGPLSGLVNNAGVVDRTERWGPPASMWTTPRPRARSTRSRWAWRARWPAKASA